MQLFLQSKIFNQKTKMRSFITMMAIAVASHSAIAQTGKKAKSIKKPAAPRTAASKPGPMAPANGKYIDVANMNSATKPGDNFYDYANGAWLRDNPVPASETRWGSFNILSDKTQAVVRSILEECAKTSGSLGSPEQMVGDFYASGMNEAQIEKLGMTPVQPYLKMVDAISNYEGLISHLAQRQRMGLGGIFGYYVGVDDKDVNTYVSNMFQGGLGLPDKDYYTKTDERSLKIQNGYKALLVQMAKFAGEANPEKSAEIIYGIEKALAAASMGRVEMRDPYKLYNKMTMPELVRLTRNFDWTSFFAKMGVKNPGDIIVAQPQFLKTAIIMLRETPVEDWKTYLRVHTLMDMAPYLSKEYENARFDFYGKILRGQKEQKPRWKRVSAVVDGGVGMQTGKIYVKRYFTPEAKTRMLDLVNNLQAVYRERIQRLDWMSNETKTQALAKLDAFTKKIAFPDKWREYKGLTIVRDNYVQNIMNSNVCDFEYNISKLGAPVDRTEWGMTPPTINAYYNPSYNEIVFPAGILQFPFFDFGADDAVNYGGIGAVIGHEMTHGFDDQGAQYAADGNLKDWWTEEDKAKFKVLTDAIVKQYNDYTVLDTVHVNGELTQGENIADLGGVTIAYEAFTRTKQFKEGKVIDGFTPAQRFFMSWAQIWRSNSTPEETAQRIATDPHSPGVYRCNGPLTNFTPFYEAFAIKPGDKMYKAPAARLLVW
jgi:putative endopeptidase